MSCSYTPSQNGRVERKHRHVTETSLALLFHSHVPPQHWVDAFNTTTYIINRLSMPVLGGLSHFEVLSGLYYPSLSFCEDDSAVEPLQVSLLLSSPRLLQLQSRPPLYLLQTWLLLQFPWTRFLPLLHQLLPALIP
ncbi:hypothetical protein CK203_096731 [Vitis vinifera]|uniref:Retrovirus-related Pol polyprotein from transposon RE1 n=1 Tax=Vitis vinifera TaxID=29760 RepID=A0A438CV27_VITVI|nr:hypothetical protein CK203_096731 [Vitis vinifera]